MVRHVLWAVTMKTCFTELVCGLILAALATATARAQPAPEPLAAQGSDIAPPAPEASPKDVQDAKDVAKQAKLTPIIPSPRDPTRPAFQLYAEIDLPLLGVGMVFANARLAKTQSAYCAPVCNQASLNGLDRLNAGYWNPSWSTSSDIGLYGLGAAAAALLIVDEGPRPGLNDVAVIVEATLGASAVSSIMTLAAGRPRPYLYGDPAHPELMKAPLSTRNSADAALSFLSGHTTMSFAIATSLYVAEHRLHPHSRRPLIVLGAGLAVASFVGVGRIMSGNHFITDVAGGAVVGSSLGVLVSSMHHSPVTVVPVVSDTQAGLGVEGHF